MTSPIGYTVVFTLRGTGRRSLSPVTYDTLASAQEAAQNGMKTTYRMFGTRHKLYNRADIVPIYYDPIA